MNNQKDMISLSGSKTWVTDTAPEAWPSLTLKLYSYTINSTGEKSEETVWTEGTLTESSTVWPFGKYVLLSEGIDMFDDASTPRLQWFKPDGSNVWYYAFTYLPKKDNGGNMLLYRVEEIMTEDPEATVHFAGQTVPGQMTASGDITNWNFINTEKTSIKVIKHWEMNDKVVDGDPFEPDRTVEVELFRKGEDSPVTMGIYVITKKEESISDDDNESLSEDEEKWQLVISDLPRYYRDANGVLREYSYYVIEKNTGIWHVEYSMDNGTTYTSAANEMGVTDESTPIHIKNSAQAYVLPATGGSGTMIYTVSGLVLALLAGVMLLSRKRKYNR